MADMETEEALRRVRLIIPMLREDVKTAVLSHEVMEAANDIVPSGMSDHYSVYVETYNAIQNAMALKLAMDLARIFDLSNPDRHPPHKQDKASVLVLAALLAREDVRASLEDAAAGWHPGIAYVGSADHHPPEVVKAALNQLEAEERSKDRADCRKAISDFLALAGGLSIDGSKESEALRRIREYRNQRLAHALFDKDPENVPRYSDLHILVSLAMEAAKLASLAIDGLNTEFDAQAQRNRKNAEGYARCVLDGLKRVAKYSYPEN